MAAVTQTVRVIRTWDVTVEAVYGDTPESLQAKVTEAYLDETAPDAETRVVIEAADSAYDALGAYECNDCTPTTSCAWHEQNGRAARKPDEEV